MGGLRCWCNHMLIGVGPRCRWVGWRCSSGQESSSGGWPHPARWTWASGRTSPHPPRHTPATCRTCCIGPQGVDKAVGGPWPAPVGRGCRPSSCATGERPVFEAIPVTWFLSTAPWGPRVRFHLVIPCKTSRDLRVVKLGWHKDQGPALFRTLGLLPPVETVGTDLARLQVWPENRILMACRKKKRPFLPRVVPSDPCAALDAAVPTVRSVSELDSHAPQYR